MNYWIIREQRILNKVAPALDQANQRVNNLEADKHQAAQNGWEEPGTGQDPYSF